MKESKGLYSYRNMIKRSSYLLTLLMLIFISNPASAQRVAVKTNVLYGGATLSPNLAVETVLTPKITLNLSGGVNFWDLGSNGNFKKFNHYLISAESRYWLYQAMDGHFWGFHGFFGSYNAGGIDVPLYPLSKLKDSRYEGYAVGAGFSYGYQWYLGAHWNLEATVGLGYAYLNYDRYECDRCGKSYGHGTKHYFGPTKLGVSFIYLFKSRK